MKLNSIVKFLGFIVIFQSVILECNGQVENYVQIENQVWMNVNLNTDKFRNGDLIPQAKTDEDFKNATENKQPAWCYYNNDVSNELKYGKLYNWYAVIDKRGLAPEGWRVPSIDEFEQLNLRLGGTKDMVSDEGFNSLKSKTGWNPWQINTNTKPKDGNGNNSSGFNGLPAGMKDKYKGFCGEHTNAIWWSTTAMGGWDGDYTAWSFSLGNSKEMGCGKRSGQHYLFYSVRCISDIEVKNENSLAGEQTIIRNPDSRKWYANKYYNHQYALFDLWSDEPIFPDANGIYRIYYATNEDKKPLTFSGTGIQLSTMWTVYKFKNLENCTNWCNGVVFVNSNSSHEKNEKIGEQILSNNQVKVTGSNTQSNDLSNFVKIGNQYWSRKNLYVTTFRNGDIITEVKSVKEWNDALNKGLPACMCLEFKAKNANKFGRIYNWYAIIDGRGLTPAGSHIPDSGEWATFILSCGGKELGDKYGVYQAEMLMAPPNIEIVKTEITEGGYYDNKMITCPNCGYWTSEQKRHNPCEKCKNVGEIEKKGPYIPETKRMVDMEINHGWQGVNANGFNALPCGYHKDFSENVFYDIKYREPIWWSTSTTSKNEPIIFQIKNNHGNTTAELSDDGKYYGRTYDSNFKPISSGGFYVRYLKD